MKLLKLKLFDFVALKLRKYLEMDLLKKYYALIHSKTNRKKYLVLMEK